MVLAIVGSRTFDDKKLFEETMTEWIVTHGQIPDEVVSGGAAGADTVAERWARTHNIVVNIMKPDWRRHGKAAGILRNTDIVNACTHMVAFPSEAGRGTQDSIRKARVAGKEVVVVPTR